jgi:hypothetical protein
MGTFITGPSANSDRATAADVMQCAHGPDLTSPSPIPEEGRGRHFYPDLWPFGGANVADATGYSELWPLGHITPRSPTVSCARRRS